MICECGLDLSKKMNAARKWQYLKYKVCPDCGRDLEEEEAFYHMDKQQ